MREMGRERPRLRRANVARRPTSGVAHAPLFVPTLSGKPVSRSIRRRRPILVAIRRTMCLWITLSI
jgi:hypothetical protein